MQWRFGDDLGLAWLHAQARAVRADPSPLPGELNRGIAEVLTEAERRKRRARFHATLLKQAYSIRDWLPPEALLHLRRVDVHAETGRVLISLWPSVPGGEGARILDTGDRIVLRGEVEDIGVAEMAACVERRKWPVVEVTGDPRFRAEMSRELLRRGIEVRDCPLSPAEQAILCRRAGGVGWLSVDGLPVDGLGDGSMELVSPAPWPP